MDAANAGNRAGHASAVLDDEPEEEPSWITDNLGMVLGMIALITISTAIVILALSGIQFTPRGERPSEIVISRDGVRESKQPTIADASRESIRRQGVKISVSRVELDRLWARDDANTVVRSASNKWILHVRVNNQVDLDRSYARWDVGSGAELVDSTGKSFPLAALDGYRDVLGKSKNRTLPPGEVIHDIVVFEASDADLETVEWLRVKLPASVFGGDGDYWFETPRSMIDGPTKDAPPPYWADESNESSGASESNEP